jgi:hypothetical protein
MMLVMLRMSGPKENDILGTMTGYNKKVEVWRYQLIKWDPRKWFWLNLQVQLAEAIMPYLIIIGIPFIVKILPLFFMLK